MSPQRIDVHHHYVTIELVDELVQMGIRHVGGQPLVASRPADSLAVMDRYEIATAPLSVPIPLTLRDASALDGLERHAGFDDEDRRAVETDNPRRLFPRVSRAP